MGQKIILKNSTHIFTGLILTGVLTLGLAGCAAAPTGDSAAEPTVISSSETVVEMGCALANLGGYGDVVPLEDVTDEYGAYCHTTIDPDSDALVYDATKVDLPSLVEFGFTEEDAKKAQQNAVRFVVEEALDSSLLDSKDPEALNTWAQANEKLFSGDWEVAASVGVVYNDSLPVLIRDGGPRAAEMTIAVEKIRAVESTTLPGQGILVVETTNIVNYRMSDEAATEYMMSADESLTREALHAKSPDLVDGVENILIVQAEYTVGYNDKGKISGISFMYNQAPITLNNNG